MIEWQHGNSKKSSNVLKATIEGQDYFFCDGKWFEDDPAKGEFQWRINRLGNKDCNPAAIFFTIADAMETEKHAALKD